MSNSEFFPNYGSIVSQAKYWKSPTARTVQPIDEAPSASPSETSDEEFLLQAGNADVQASD